MSTRIKAGKTGHKTLTPQDMEALAPGLGAYAGEAVALVLGLALLTAVARQAPARAVSLAAAWVMVMGVLAFVINTALTMRLMGGFDTFTLAGIPALVHLATWMALLFVSAAGPKLVKEQPPPPPALAPLQRYSVALGRIPGGRCPEQNSNAASANKICPLRRMAPGLRGRIAVCARVRG